MTAKMNRERIQLVVGFVKKNPCPSKAVVGGEMVVTSLTTPQTIIISQCSFIDKGVELADLPLFKNNMILL